MQNSRNELGLFAVPFLLYSYEKKKYCITDKRFTANSREALFFVQRKEKVMIKVVMGED